MARPKQDVTEKELEIMEILWGQGTGGATIRGIAARIYPRGSFAQYTTVKKLIERLEEKGFVARKTDRMAHEFSAANAPEAFYTRWGNPTTRVLEGSLAELEGGAKAIATGSGMGAISSAILAVVSKGDRVVAGKSLYTATTEMFTRVLPRFGVETTLVDGPDLAAWRNAVRPNTKLFFLETPSNPMTEISDIPALAAVAKKAGALLAVDNVFCTPVLQRPLELGADLVIHSATKHLDGQGRVLAGAVLGSTKLVMEQVFP